MAELRKRGYTSQVVEKWNHHAHIRQDLFGFIDILAIGEKGCVGIQATSTSNVNARVIKSMQEHLEVLTEWLKAGNSFAVWGWAKRGPAGKRKLWTLRAVDVYLGVTGTPVAAVVKDEPPVTAPPRP